MKNIKLFCIILIQCLFAQAVYALDIHLTNPPGDYNVYRWNDARRTVDHSGSMTRNIQGYTFSVPDQYVIKRGNEVDLQATLRNWRRSTPVADGNPRTRNNIGYYPFTDSSGNRYYLALEYLNERIGRYNGAAITTSAGGAPPVAAAPPADSTRRHRLRRHLRVPANLRTRAPSSAPL